MLNVLKPVAARLRSGGGPARLLAPDVLKNLLPLVLLASGITALVLMFMWRAQASYKPLFGARENVDAAAMMSALDEAGISYRVHPDTGQVLVPGDRVGEVRMLLASKGVVARLPAGLELMDRNDPLGVSQFVQDVRFRRGLEGELAQSIMSLDAVQSARVHLSIARSSSFVLSDGEKSSASVVVTLKPSRELKSEQIAAIINMVAGSVAGLDPSRVTLVDQNGNLLSARVDLSEGFEAGQGNEAARYYQEETRRNVHDLLAPVLGADNFKVSVTADVDNDRIKETHEQYGETPRLTSEAVREELDRDSLALGVPGSLSNRPVAVNMANAEEAGADPLLGSAQRNASTRQYAYDRSITQIQRSRGRLKKLSIAVVLNNAAAPGGAGAWSAQQLADIERVLEGGLGIDRGRGDQLVVSAMTFPSPAPLAPWWQQPENVIDFGTWVFYAIGALLAYLLIVRPLLRMAQQRLAMQPAALAPAGPALAAQGAAALPGAESGATEAALTRGAVAVGPLVKDYDLPPPGSPVDVMVDHLRVLAAKEPERVAEVVKQWVQKNVRTE